MSDEIRYVLREKLTDETEVQKVYDLLEACDEDFVPPLSFRGGTSVKKLEGETKHSDGVMQYFNEMKEQAIMLMMEGDQLLSFLTYKPHFTCDHLAQFGDVYYLTTLCVDHTQRGKHLATNIFKAVIRACQAEDPSREITMRTWSTNAPQMHLVQKLGFEPVKVLKDDRGPGVDTVYFVYRGE